MMPYTVESPRPVPFPTPFPGEERLEHEPLAALADGTPQHGGHVREHRVQIEDDRPPRLPPAEHQELRGDGGAERSAAISICCTSLRTTGGRSVRRRMKSAHPSTTDI